MQIETLRTTRMGWVKIAKSLAPPVLWHALYKRLVVKNIPDATLYRPHFQPWLAPEFLNLFEQEIEPYTVVPIQSCWTIWQSVHQAINVEGDLMEAGVFQGGTARLIRQALAGRTDKRLFLFDSFEGMQTVSAEDRHRRKDFADTSLDAVRSVVGTEPFIEYRKGWVPETFAGLEDRRFCFAHIDLDLYQGVSAAVEFVYSRMPRGGVIVFDDYGFASCPGARKAVDQFFSDKLERPLALSSGQALVTKL